MPRDETRNTYRTAPSEPDRAAAWDQVGRTLQDMAEVGEVIGRRSLAYWQSVAERLRTSEYDADAMAADLMNGFTTALQNAQDAWSLLSGPPPRVASALDLPTVFVRLTRTVAGGTFGVTSPVTIRIPRDVEEPPETAEVVFQAVADGTTAKLTKALRPLLSRDGYVLESVESDDDLTPGLYSGLVFMPGAARPLAHLAVLVGDDTRPAPGGGG